jgi:hypothetical protein
MPALLKKSFTRSFSKKWNSVTGKNSTSKTSGVDDTPAIITSDDHDEYGCSLQPSPLDILKENMGTPSPYYEGPPQAGVVSDTSSDDDSSGEEDAAQKYGYGEAEPDSEQSQMPKRLSSRIDAGRRSRASISRQTPLNLSNGVDDDSDDDENLPFHPKRTPRRSSLKVSQHGPGRRRASLGICQDRRTSIKEIEEDVAAGLLAKSQVIEVKLPMRRESVTRRVSIQFDEDVYVRKILPSTSVKGADKNEMWFQDDEYSTIKKKTRALLEKVDSNGVVNGKKYCTRGLEKYMEDPTKRAQEKYEAWDSVLDEQELQRKLKVFNDESIGRSYKRTSIVAAEEAHSRANADAAEVAAFFNNQ